MAAYDEAVTSEDPGVIKAARTVQKTAVTKAVNANKKEMDKKEEMVLVTKISKEVDKLNAAFSKLEVLHERYQSHREKEDGEN